MKSLHRILVLLLVVCTWAHTATAQQLPSQRPKDAMLSSQTQQKLRELQAQWSGATTPVQEQRLPSNTVDEKKYAALLPPHQNTMPSNERVNKLPSNTKKMRPPARRPKLSQ